MATEPEFVLTARLQACARLRRRVHIGLRPQKAGSRYHAWALFSKTVFFFPFDIFLSSGEIMAAERR